MFVVALKCRAEEDGGLWSVRVTGIRAAGLPRVVSRTWHVMGGLVSVGDMVCGVCGGLGRGERWVDMAWMRVVGVDAGIQVCVECWVGCAMWYGTRERS